MECASNLRGGETSFKGVRLTVDTRLPTQVTPESAADSAGARGVDVRLMAELGARAYRFSVSWPRVLPMGTGAVNQPGLDFYERLVDALLAAGVQPLINLFHWDLPQALQDRGGFANPEVVGWFTDFAAYEQAMASPEWKALVADGPELFDMSVFLSGIVRERVLKEYRG